MKKLKDLFKSSVKTDRTDLVITKDNHDVNADELAAYIRNLEAENKILKDTTSEYKTISYKLGKIIIDTLNKQSSSKQLPTKLLNIYTESRKRKLSSIKNANLVDKALILLSDKELLNDYRLNNAKLENNLEYKNNSRTHKTVKPVNVTHTTLEQRDTEKSVLNTNTTDLIVSKNSNVNMVDKKPALGLFSYPETMKLSLNAPIWHEVPVQAGQILIIKAASQYLNTEATNRKAILLIKSYDPEGNEILEPCGKMSKSKQLNAYFKYLPSTNNKVQELHAFIVPNGVSQIHIGLCCFNTTKDEQVLVSNFSIKPKVDDHKLVKFVAPSAQAAEISIIGWPEYPVNDKPYIIGIMDEFTTGSFEKDVNLIQPRPDNWFALAEKYKPVLFFIESAWKGNYGSWQYRVGQYANKPGYEIEHICQYARDKGIPTLFWNKEDPVHHDKFMCSAKLVDYIYTTDANMKASYTAKTGNTNVHSLPFAAQSALHKPAPLLGRKSRSCFAGSWYGNRHAERGEAMNWLLQAANKYGLDIYDRNYGTGIFPFPEEYQAGIKGSLPYKELCREYNRYRVFLNVNSVTESPTMFSRRVFELMACGTPVVSTYAKGIEALFDSDAVWLVHSKEEADEAIHILMTDDVEWRRRSLAGIREIFSKHTYAHRLNGIFSDIGIEKRIAIDPNIMILAKANSQVEMDMLIQFTHTQSYRNFYLVIESEYGKAFVTDKLPENIALLALGEVKAWAYKNQNKYTIAGWLTPSNYYGEYYLRDLINASIYEPEAKGWAKALGKDVFDYGAPAILGGALWQINDFLNNHIDAKAHTHIMDSELYTTDGDQFGHLGLESKQP